MNKKNNQFVPICFLVAVVLFFAVAFTIAKPAYEEYGGAQSSKVSVERDLKNKSEALAKEEQREAKEAMNLKSIKPIYASTTKSSDDSLAAFGTMFDDIIKLAQSNNLFIRSIEYDTKPAENTVYNTFSEQYHVCKLKFFFVGKYPQLRNFLNDITKDGFKYLLAVSDLNVTAFKHDTDYLLIKMSITLYSKKPVDD